MKIVLALDKFKDSAAAPDICAALSRGLRTSGILPIDTEIMEIPLADGGEGTSEIVGGAMESRGALVRRLVVEGVEDPLGRPVSAPFFLSEHGGSRTAVIEMSAASGLSLLGKGERDPMRASTYGTGQMIRAALGHSPDRIIIGIGGSATVDGGTGCAAALGVRFYDEKVEAINRPDGAALSRICSMDVSGLDPRLTNTDVTIAADVENLLTGHNGAARIYGPQKGASPTQMLMLQEGLTNLVKVIVRTTHRHCSDLPGAGAAGGLGFGLMSLLPEGRVRMERGIDLVMRELDFTERICGSDVVITGEGRFDSQSLSGKAVAAVAERCEEQGIPVIILAGTAPLRIMERVRSGGVPGAREIFTLVKNDSDGDEVEAAKRNVENLIEKKGSGIAEYLVSGMP